MSRLLRLGWRSRVIQAVLSKLLLRPDFEAATSKRWAKLLLHEDLPAEAVKKLVTDLKKLGSHTPACVH